MSKNNKKLKNYQKAKAFYQSMNGAQRGELLTMLIELYNEKQTQQTLMPIMQCLMDDLPVGVPMKVTEEGLKTIEAAKANHDGQPTKVSMKTVILKNEEGNPYLPVFSKKTEVPEDLLKRYYWLQMSFKEVARMVKNMESVNEIVINPFTKKLVLPQQALDGITIMDELRPSKENE